MRIATLSLLLACPLVTSAGPGLPESSAPTGAFELRVPSPGPNVVADTILQQAIDTVAQAGGGVVLLGVGEFKLSRKAGDETIVLKSGITLRGQGHATHLYLDPADLPPENGTVVKCSSGSEKTRRREHHEEKPIQ